MAKLDPTWIAVGKSPIPGDAPAGRSVREDARFSELRQEIDKLTSIQPDVSGPDWNRVATLGTELLGTLGKDISVASWVAASFLHLHGEEGIAAGVTLMAEMCSSYWDGLFPSRTRARMGAIDWWQDQIAGWLESTRPEYLSAQVKEVVDAQLTLLDQTIAAAEPDNSLRLHMLRAQIARLPSPPEAAPKVVAEAPAASVQEAAPVAVSDDRSVVVAPIADAPVAPVLSGDAPATAFLSGSTRFCLDAADALLARDASLPASYVLRRAALWAGFVNPPPAEGGRTRIPAPEEHILPGLNALLEAGECEKALRMAESQCNAYPYWLDLCRISVLALAGLGGNHDGARRALEGEIIGFAHRFPEVSTLAFADGTPFAGGATRQWLNDLGGQGGTIDPFDAELGVAVARAPAAALEALGALLLAHPGDRHTLLIYRAAFEVCLKGELWLPLPYLAMRLLTLVAAHGLLVYDAAAAADALSAAAAALSAALVADAGSAQVRAQYERVGEALAGLQPHRLA
ncbi:MAG: type VI secretion system protein TssA [Candidatus Accumulibacter sp.]|nr:type VI secretion system protein TssA [Accumulibacter sp.]